METIRILVFPIFGLMLFGCKSNSETIDKDLQSIISFHEKFGSYDFDRFRCLNIYQWTQNRPNKKMEFHVELFPNCSDTFPEVPLRGKLKYIQKEPLFVSNDVDVNDLPVNLFSDFFFFVVCNLFYKKEDNLVVSIYPNIWIWRSCKSSPGNEYVQIDSCWYYKILK